MVTMDFSTWQGMRERDPRRITLGSAQWGMPYGIANQDGPPNESELRAILATAREAGVHSIDTARAYGESELRIGHAVEPADGWRIVTKLAPDLEGDGADLGEVLGRVTQSLETSREALGQGALTTVLLHRFAHRHACGGRLWRLLLAEREAGRIVSLGVSAATPEQAWAALEDPDIEVLQVASSLLDLRLFRQGFFQRARELGRSVYVRSIFLQGLAFLPPTQLPKALSALAGPIETIHEAAASLGVAPQAFYLAFARALPGVLPVLGCERAHQLESLLADWSSEAIDGVSLSRLVEQLPTAEDDLVDPSRWPRFEAGGSDPSANQTSAASVATMRA